MGDPAPHPAPPKRAESWLRRRVAARPSARFIVGDLREEYAAVHGRRGYLVGILWYWTQVLCVAAPRHNRRLPGNSKYKEQGLMLDSLLSDLRFGLRSLRRQAGVSTAAGTILAVAIGATTAIFSVVDGIMLRPLPFPEPEQIVRLGWQWAGVSGATAALSPLKMSYWEEHSDSFEALATFRVATVELTAARGESRQLEAVAASHGFLDVLGVAPAVGRGFRADETVPGAPKVVILGDRLWRERYGSDPGALGETLPLGDDAYTIIGVLPADFEVPTLEEYGGLLLPLQRVLSAEDRGHNFPFIGRLRPGLGRDQAAVAEAALSKRFGETYPDRYSEGETMVLMGFLDPFLGSRVKLVLWTLLGAVGLVLLIACANVANLMLLRAAARRAEFAARAALGASRVRIVRQLLVESLMLAFVSAAGGVLLAYGGLDALVAMIPQQLPRMDQVSVNLRVLTVALALTLTTGAVFGMAAALPGTRTDLRTVLGEAGRAASEGRGTARLRGVLVVGQVAVSVALLSAAGVLLVTFARLARADLGFDVEEIWMVQLRSAPGQFAGEHAVRELQGRLLEAARALPGVHAAATAGNAPLERGWNLPATVFTHDEQVGLTVEIRLISADYFRALGTPVLRGRPIVATDQSEAAPVTVVNEALVAKLPAGADPMSASVAVGLIERDGTWIAPSFERPPHRVVGVVGDVKEYGAMADARPTIYVHFEQAAPGLGAVPRLLIRAPSAISVAPVRQRLLDLEPGLRSAEIVPMSTPVSRSIARERFNAILMASFGAMALLLTLVGLYGILAGGVHRRVREIGVRVALGARPARILAMVMFRGIAMVAIGLVLGMAAAVAAGNLLESMVFEVSPTDPILLAAVGLSFLVVALFACGLPALRATRIDPVEALRGEG